MGQHNQTYKYQLPINHYHDNSIQFIKSHLSVWGFLCIMIHSSIILAIPCPINLTPNQGLIKPNSNIKEYTEPWKKVGFETLHLSLRSGSGSGNEDLRRLRSGQHHHFTAPARGRERERACDGEERERERATRGRERWERETAQERRRESSTARVFDLREFSAELRFRFVMRQKGRLHLFL